MKVLGDQGSFQFILIIKPELEASPRFPSSLSHVFRVSDREAAVEAGLKLLHQFYLDLEKFLSWLTEAETTCNVLIDATNKERLQDQPEAAKRLLAQWKVGHGLTHTSSSLRRVIRLV